MKICSLSNATTQNPTCVFNASDNPAALKCLSEPAHSDYPTPLEISYFLFHLSNSLQGSFGHSKYILSLLFSLRLEAQKFVYLAAKEHKESTMLEAYRSLMMQDTIVMSEDVRSEHVQALRCFREKLFAKTD